MPTPFLPYQRDPIAGNLTTPNSWYEFFRSLRQFIIDSGLDVGVIDQILARLDELEENQSGDFLIQGLLSVKVLGTPPGGLVQVQLENDVDQPGRLYAYRVDDDGVKGWSLIKPDETPSSIGVYMVDEAGDWIIDEDNRFQQSDLLLQVAADPDSTISNIQQTINYMLTPGIVSGCILSRLDVDTVRISAGRVLFASADDDGDSDLVFFNVPQVDFDIPADQETRYFAWTYNGGSPLAVMQTVDDFNRDTQIPVGLATRFNGTMVVTPNRYRTSQPVTNIIQRADALSPIIRDADVGGITLGALATRISTISAGRLWARLEDFTITAKASNTTPMVSTFFNGTGLTFTTGLTQWDNLNFNNLGTGSLQALGLNKWAVLWFFLAVDGTYGFAYGIGEHNTQGAAANEALPPYLNQDFLRQAYLVGRYVFQRGEDIPTLVEQQLSALANISVINDHNSLANLQVDGGAVSGEYYHLSQAQAVAVDAAVAAGGGFVNVAGTQTVTGAKTFTAVNTWANLSPQKFQGGSGNGAIIIGADVNATTLTANTRKVGRMVGPTYDNTSPSLLLFAMDHDVTSSRVYYGGFAGSTTVTAAMRLLFHTAAVAHTLGGTLRWEIDQNGHFIPGATNTYDIGTSALRVATVYAVNLNQSGARFESGVVSPAQLTANTDNWAVTGITTAAIIRASTDASRNLTGIASPTSGQMLRLINVGAQDLVLVHDATSTAANRFFLPNSANLTLNPNDSVSLWYDNTSSRWRALGV